MSKKHTQLPNSAYAIGLIVALWHELSVAEAMLDEKHGPPLRLDQNDKNIYTLGSIKGHNVVIGAPSGIHQGQSAAASKYSAATTVMYMLSSFPNLKLGLSVGIGGGIPTMKRDIRLGDVVVGQPVGNFGGIRQYRFATTRPQGFVEMDSLNPPPPIVIDAISDVKSRHKMGNNTMNLFLLDILHNNQDIGGFESQKEYLYQGEENDRLFYPESEHTAGESNCLRCDRTKEIARPIRYDRSPVIFYGAIASGTESINNAQIRNLYFQQNGYLCFEMEAAGLMKDVPCLVIRGISDYNDTHKNNLWERYAAASAVAYAKEVLQVMDPKKVQELPQAKDIMAIGLGPVAHRKYEQTLALAFDEHISEGYKEQNQQEFDDILNWLSPTDYSSLLSGFLRRRQKDTGTWFLESPNLQTWLDHKARTLFCHGKPGAGKSTMAATIVNDLFRKYKGESTVGIAYMFCSFSRQREQTLEHILSNLLKQLIHTSSSGHPWIEVLHNMRARNSPLSSSDLTILLGSVFAAYSRVFVIVDAIDECQAGQEICQKLMATLFRIQEKTGINILVTSRWVPEIATMFTISGCAMLEIRANPDDIKHYLAEEMKRIDFSIDRELLKELELGLIKAADGMFLFAALVLKNLIGQPTIADIRRTIRSFNEAQANLDTIYQKALQKIEYQSRPHQEIARQALSWIMYAERQISAVEIQEAMRFKPRKAANDYDLSPSINLLETVCAGLVRFDTQSGSVQFIHHSAREFLMDKWRLYSHDAHLYIAETCVDYLTRSSFEEGHCKTETSFQKRLQSNVLYDYASQFWGYHIRESGAENFSLIGSFLLDESKLSASSQVMAINTNLGNHTFVGVTGMTPLHMAAYFGLLETFQRIAFNGADIEAKESLGGQTPLIIAARYGNLDIVKLLLQKGAEPKVKDASARTALSWAVWNGNMEITELLLRDGRAMAIEEATEYHRVALALRASKNGVEEWIELSFETFTPLLWAAKSGHEAIVGLLVSKGANVDARSSHTSETPLLWATKEGHVGAVNLLLSLGADIDARDPHNHWTPILWASRNGGKALVKDLLKRGAEIESRDYKFNRTPLSIAAELGHRMVVQILLEAGANVQSEDRDGRTARSWAKRNGHLTILKLLEETGKTEATPFKFTLEPRLPGIKGTVCETHSDIHSEMDTGTANTPLTEINSRSPSCRPETWVLQPVNRLGPTESNAYDIPVQDEHSLDMSISVKANSTNSISENGPNGRFNHLLMKVSEELKSRSALLTLRELSYRYICPFAAGDPISNVACLAINRRDLQGVKFHIQNRHHGKYSLKALYNCNTWEEIFDLCYPSESINRPSPYFTFSPLISYAKSVGSMMPNLVHGAIRRGQKTLSADGDRSKDRASSSSFDSPRFDRKSKANEPERSHLRDKSVSRAPAAFFISDEQNCDDISETASKVQVVYYLSVLLTLFTAHSGLSETELEDQDRITNSPSRKCPESSVETEAGNASSRSPSMAKPSTGENINGINRASGNGSRKRQRKDDNDDDPRRRKSLKYARSKDILSRKLCCPCALLECEKHPACWDPRKKYAKDIPSLRNHIKRDHYNNTLPISFLRENAGSWNELFEQCRRHCKPEWQGDIPNCRVYVPVGKKNGIIDEQLAYFQVQLGISEWEHHTEPPRNTDAAGDVAQPDAYGSPSVGNTGSNNLSSRNQHGTTIAEHTSLRPWDRVTEPNPHTGGRNSFSDRMIPTELSVPANFDDMAHIFGSPEFGPSEPVVAEELAGIGVNYDSLYGLKHQNTSTRFNQLDSRASDINRYSQFTPNPNSIMEQTPASFPYSSTGTPDLAHSSRSQFNSSSSSSIHPLTGNGTYRRNDTRYVVIPDREHDPISPREQVGPIPIVFESLEDVRENLLLHLQKRFFEPKFDWDHWKLKVCGLEIQKQFRNTGQVVAFMKHRGVKELPCLVVEH